MAYRGCFVDTSCRNISVAHMIEFSWRAPINGYEWQHLKDCDTRIRGRYLTETGSPEETQSYRNYAVFKETGLFRTFAALQTDETSIAAFANPFGWLGGRLGVGLVVAVSKPLSQKNLFQPVPGESLDGWCREILDLRHAVELEDKARTGQ